MEVEVEDDVFFADLSKQISLLVMEEEEEEFELGFPVQCPPQLHHQEIFLPPMLPQVTAPPSARCVPEVPFLRESIASKGTGVFIPRSSNAPAKRKNRSKRSTVNLSAHADRTHNREFLHKSNKNNSITH